MAPEFTSETPEGYHNAARGVVTQRRDTGSVGIQGSNLTGSGHDLWSQSISFTPASLDLSISVEPRADDPPQTRPL